MIKHCKYIVVVIMVALLLLPGIRSHAQQDPIYTQFLSNMLMVNPAYAGSKGMLSLNAMSRTQWVDFEGAPQTYTFSAHTPFTVYNIGLGINFLSDEVGPVCQKGVYIDYSYTIGFGQNHNLSMGLMAGFNSHEVNLTELDVNDGNDPSFQEDINRSLLPNFGVGLYYFTSKLYMGISVPKLIRNDINGNNSSSENLSRQELHWFYMGGCLFELNEMVKFKPFFFAKAVRNSPISLDLNAHIILYDRLWLGAMYRISDSFGGICQLQITDQIKVGYAYDLTTSEMRYYNGGTHEVMVTFDFDFGGKRIRSPRYF